MLMLTTISDGMRVRVDEKINKFKNSEGEPEISNAPSSF